MIKLSSTLELPAEIAGRRTAIFGISGSGKSNTATVIVEGLLAAGEQVVLIDSKGEGWGLLSLANGKPSNLDLIIFGEPHGHIPALSENHGQKIADFVVESGRSVVLSLLGFESDQSERRFVASFLRELYRRKSKQARPTRTLLVFEEAHLFVPESSGRGFKGEAADLAGAVQRIVRQGRSHGIGSLIVDQRPQDVAKRVVTQCDTLICHQLTHKTDREALRDWVKGYDVSGEGDAFLASLASLQPGEAWIWSPSWLKMFQRCVIARRKTFDSGSAPDGSAAAQAVQRAEIDLDKLRGQLTEIVEKAKADDPKALRAKIADLEKQLYKSGRTVQTDPKDLERAVAAAVAQREREWQARDKEQVKIIGDFKGRLGKIQTLAHVNGEAVGIPPAPSIDPAETGQRPARTLSDRRGGVLSPAGSAQMPKESRQREQRPDTQRSRKPEESSALTDFQLNKTQQRIIDALAWYESLGNMEPTVVQIGAVALIDATGGYFSNTVGPLSTQGLIDRPTGRLRLTDAGRSLARPIEAPESLDAYHEVLRQRVRKMNSASGKTIEVLNAIIAAGGSELTAEEIGQAVGIDHTGGYFSNTIGPLGTAGLIERARGKVVPTEVLFPEGLS